MGVAYQTNLKGLSKKNWTNNMDISQLDKLEELHRLNPNYDKDQKICKTCGKKILEKGDIALAGDFCVGHTKKEIDEYGERLNEYIKE